jgi:hypothetical protein
MNRILPNNTAKKVNNALPTAVANVANKTVNGVANAFNVVANNTKNVVQNTAKEAAAVMENAPAAMNDALFGVPEAVGNAVTNAANKMTNFASNAAKSVGNVVGNAATSVSNAANSALNTVGLGNSSNRNNSGNNSGNNSSRNNNGSNSNSGSNNNGSNKGFFNSFKSNSVSNSVNSLLGNNATSAGEGSFFASAWFIALIVLLTIFGIFVFFFDQIMELLPQSVRDGFNRLKEALGIPVEPAPPAPEPPAPEPPPPAPEEPGIIPGVPTPAYLPDSGAENGNGDQASGAQTLVTDFEKIFEKQLPQKKENKEVFNIKENRYKFEDAEPLCNALGAELATYEQVKEAYEHGADWCNYGWVKGQRAVYPTQPGTYEKLQKGPKEQHQACGKPGINGGYFDNPDLRFGVTCYGVKPPQKDHDKSLLPNGEANPFTPDALEYDKRVAEFKADSNNIGILPFSEKRWDEA